MNTANRNSLGEQSQLGSLESHLWEAANILRGPVDAADFKTYVFPLLFFKRISDVHDEEHQAALGSAVDGEYPRSARGRIHLQSRLRHRRHVTGSDSSRQGEPRRR